MDTIAPRPLTQHEIDIVREALKVALVPSLATAPPFSPESMRVVCRCPCGCASVGFVPEDKEVALNATLLADADASTPTGQPVGVIIWGTPDKVTGLEVHWWLAEGAPLPTAGTLRARAADA